MVTFHRLIYVYHCTDKCFLLMRLYTFYLRRDWNASAVVQVRWQKIREYKRALLKRLSLARLKRQVIMSRPFLKWDKVEFWNPKCCLPSTTFGAFTQRKSCRVSITSVPVHAKTFKFMGPNPGPGGFRSNLSRKILYPVCHEASHMCCCTLIFVAQVVV